MEQQSQCIRHHRFLSFIAALPNEILLYTAAMPKVDIINCKNEGATVAYLFAPSMSSKSTTIGNINVFEDLNIGQRGLKKKTIAGQSFLLSGGVI